MNEQRITFRNQLSDLEVYSDYYAHTPEGRRYGRRGFFSVQIVWLALSIGIGGLFQMIVGSSWLAIAFALLIFLLIECATLLLSDFQPSVHYARLGVERSIRQLNQRDKEIFLLSKECRIAPEGFGIRHELAEHFWKWEAIDRVVYLPGFLVIQIGSSFSPIPQRAFESNQQFEDFVRAAQEFHRAQRETPTSAQVDDKQVVPARAPRRPRTFLRILAVVFLFLFSCILLMGIINLFESKVPSTEQAQAVLDEYMRAMQAQDTMQALSCLSQPTLAQKASLDEQLQGIDLARYAGYQGLEITYFEAGVLPGGAQATVIADVRYQNQHSGLIYARLLAWGDEWKIEEIGIYLSPQEVEQFLRNAR